MAVPAYIGGRGTGISGPTSLPAATPAATPDISSYVKTAVGDLNSGDYAGALQAGLDSGKLYGTNYNSVTTDPLLQALESGTGLQALDPSKKWDASSISQYYAAFDANPVTHGKQSGATAGESWGKDPYGQWGDMHNVAGQAALNAGAAGDSSAPDVQRFLGAKPSQSFLSKYGGDIAMLAAAVAAPELIGAIAPAIGGIGAGAVVGGGLSAATDAITGRPLTAGSVLGGALGGAAGAGLTGLAGNAINGATGLGSTVSTGLAGAGIGAARTAMTGGNIGLSALTGGIGGAVQGSGIGNTLKTGLKGAGFNGTASNALVNGGIGYAVGGATGLATSALMGNGGVGNGSGSGSGSSLGNAAGALSQGAQGAQGNNGNMASTDTSLAGTIVGALPGAIQGAAGVYGSQNAAEKQTQADQNAIGTQQTNLGNINSIWGTQQQLGQGAQTALGTALGTNGKPADYSGFENMPGYQFAVQQGTQAIQRQAASMGNAYTPNTAAAVGQYVTGTASQDYNTYIQQLMGAAGLGSTANTQLQSGNQSTANNVSQLQQNQGYAQASGVSGASNAVGGLFGANGAGTSLLGAASKFLSGVGGSSGGGGGGGGGSSNGGGSSGSSANSTGTGNGSFGSGVDPSTGQPWVDPNMQAPSFDTSSVDMPTMPSIDTNNYNFGGGLDYGNSTNDMFSGTNYLGGF